MASSSEIFITLVLKIYLKQSEYSSELFIHLVRLVRGNINRNIFQNFILKNLEFIARLAQNAKIDEDSKSSKNDDFTIIINSIIKKYPSKIISYQYLFQPLLQNGNNYHFLTKGKGSNLPAVRISYSTALSYSSYKNDKSK